MFAKFFTNLAKLLLYLLGEEEKEEVKDAVEDETNFEDAPQEDNDEQDAFAEDEDEQLEQEDENGEKCYFDVSQGVKKR